MEFILRDASKQDINDICELGALLNTINLPAQKSELEQVIALSERSFSLEETNAAERCFLFVLVNAEKRVIGASQIRAQHGTLNAPHTYFQINTDERYSPTLKKYFQHQTLRLVQNFCGPTEIGSLVLAKNYRSHEAALGRQISFVRFLFIAMNKNFFRDHVLAELMPPLGPHFESALWNAIGYKFTGLDYATADMLSRKNKEFIKSLFPAGDIYLNLLPTPAQEVIGQIGPDSLGAARLLSSIGFRYSLRVDPFDGGPHFEVPTEHISIIKNARHGLNSESTNAQNIGLVGCFNPEKPSGQRFRAVKSYYSYDTSLKNIYINQNTRRALMLNTDSVLWAIDLYPARDI